MDKYYKCEKMRVNFSKIVRKIHVLRLKESFILRKYKKNRDIKNQVLNS